MTPRSLLRFRPARGTAVVAVITSGLLVGGGVVAVGGVVGASTAPPSDASPTDADEDLAAACLVLSNLPEPADLFENEGWALDGPLLWRLQAVAGGFTAAANADDRYAGLDDLGETLFRSQSLFDTDALDDALDEARTFCAESAPFTILLEPAAGIDE